MLKNKRKIASLILIMMFSIIFMPFSSVVYAADDPTTEESTYSSSINDFSVSLDENGNLETSFENDDTNSTSLWNWINDKGKVILTGLTAVCTTICAGILIVSCVRFSGSGSNPTARKSAITGILIGLIGVALLGGVTLIMALSWNFLS